MLKLFVDFNDYLYKNSDKSLKMIEMRLSELFDELYYENLKFNDFLMKFL